MGHMIQGIIGKPETLQKITISFSPAQLTIEELPQDFKLLLLCEKAREIIDAQVNLNNNTIKPFEFFDSKLKKHLESTGLSGIFAYIETDYFGGVGTQSAGFFKDGKLLESYKGDTRNIDPTIPWPDRLLDEPINKVLRKIGVLRNPDLDEFDTLGLGEYRHMPYNEI